ncbi:tripartite tricarboxylate transporter TctB family protein [Bradyrhizobium sp. LHD-71]|uniref:tripartite tricarboxylate transporter TctB family protein n=1 Tax=Bradyrhizobium sp. LHD-71 TaxID=3072141 RepID=UPI00280C6BE5|nr:tripartite tricarboxylate transporter TctB family protein [Bradyrhizobium sp. LHD-71]MDQ8731852.1 tripartite tricarboxylate transporter TctB family protein [Bradyrhizobium sp. LHD-71]
MLIPDRVSGIMLVGLGAAAAYGGSLLPPVPGQQIGPNVFPMVVGIGLLLCGGLIAFGVGSTLEREAEAELAAHSDQPAPETAHSPLMNGAKTLLPPALLLAYVFVGDALGFIPTAFAIVLTVALAMGARLRLALPLALIAPVFVHLVFVKLLRVPLPPGILPMPW